MRIRCKMHYCFTLLFFLFYSYQGYSQEIRRTYVITGTIIEDKTSEPLVGANVLIEGTSIGAAADAEGQYSIEATLPPGAYTLTHTFLSYKKSNVRVNLGTETNINVGQVRMEEDLLQIDEVVVTGTGTATEKERLGNSISTLGGDLISGGAPPTVDAGLVGKVPGAQVNQNSGTPGGGVSVRLRGTSTISGSAEPLYIVDGVYVDNSSNELVNLGGYVGNRIADLDPNDIDRIEIVKGAAAAALYGSRANNGVIQIFTKSGKTGAPRITFRTRGGFSDIRKTYEVNLFPYDKPPTDTTRQLVTRRDYQEDIFRTGHQYENHLSISGGTDKTRYYVSGSHSYEAGIVQATDYRKVNFRANLDQFISNWLRMSVGTNYINSHSERVPNGGIVGGEGVITNFAFQPNWFDLTPNEEGEYPTPPFSGFANQLEVINRWQSPLAIRRFIGSLQFTATPLQNLTIEYRTGYDQYTENANRQIPIGSSAGYITGFSQQALQELQQINNDLIVTLNNSFSNFSFSTVAGFNHQYLTTTSINASVRDLIPVTTILSSGATATASEFRQERVILGYFLQETIGFQDKLFLTGSLRIDGASTFGEDERFQLFPKASLSYVLSKENWWTNIFGNILNRFKIRAAWGESGGQPAGTYDRFSIYLQQTNSNRPGLVNAQLLGNENLKPERMTEIEVGADMGLFNDHLTLELTYYEQTIKDLLLRRTLAPSTGYTGILDNVGELSNKGYELLARGIVLNTPDIQWLSTLTLSHNKNRVTKLIGPAFAVENSFGIARVAQGEPLGFFYGTTYVRNSDGTIALTPAGLPIRDPAAKKIGDPNPDLIIAFSNEFRLFENFDLRIQFDGMLGQDIFNFTRRILETPAFGNGREYERELSGELPPGYFNVRRTIFEEYIEDGSYIKLRELSLGYRFNPDFITSMGIRNVEIRLIGRNLFSFDDYRGYDPEVNVSSQSTLVRGFDWSTIPLPRTLIFSLAINI